MYCPNCGKKYSSASSFSYCPLCGERLRDSTASDGEERPTPTHRIEGLVRTFNWNTGGGVITGSDGNRYQYTRQEWNSQSGPRPGVKVDFVSEGQYARNIYVLRPSSPNAGPTRSQDIPMTRSQRTGMEKNDANPWLDFVLGLVLGFLGLVVMLIRMPNNELRWDLFLAGMLAEAVLLFWLLPYYTQGGYG